VRARRGLTLVLTLWLVVVLMAMVYSLVWDVQMEVRLRGLAVDHLGARWLAQAGAAKAIADLGNDVVSERSEDSTTPPADALGDIWAFDNEDKVNIELTPLIRTRGRRFRRRRGRDEVPGGTFTVVIEDAESRINLNAASVDLLTSLVIALDEELEEDGKARRIAEIIVDWRDENTEPVSESAEPGFQEQRHWSETLLDEDGIIWDGVFHNRRFLTPEELLTVPGITEELFYGAPLEAEEEDPRRSRRRRRRSEEEPVGLRDCVTTLSNGQININTARREVLAALAMTALGSGSDWEEVADAIIEQRDGRRLDDPDDDTPFTSVQDLANIPIAAPLAARGQLRLATRSQNFTVRSTGRSGSAHHSVVCEVRRSWEVYIRDYETLARQRGGSTQLEIETQYREFLREQAERADRASRRRDRERRMRRSDDPRVEMPVVRILTWAEN
jgi:type II secretory pathway component PulK